LKSELSSNFYLISSYYALVSLQAATRFSRMIPDHLRADLETVTQQRALAPQDSYVQLLARLDAAQQAALPERLQHYLSRRSYVKALQWLDNPDLPHHP
jgi:hypothetical protein